MLEIPREGVKSLLEIPWEEVKSLLEIPWEGVKSLLEIPWEGVKACRKFQGRGLNLLGNFLEGVQEKEVPRQGGADKNCNSPMKADGLQSRSRYMNHIQLRF